MTVTVTGDDDVLEQIEKQLAKLVDVKEIVELPSNSSVCRELILVKVQADASQRQDVAAVANIFRANIVDVKENTMTIELTGNQSKLNAFIELLEDFKITELARTGITGLARGAASLK
jgi:acetolactate synthase-1/3 small subunit